ncbi:MAG: hypothetical protein M1823_007479, partial [Watsoniomyces obsoletus]
MVGRGSYFTFADEKSLMAQRMGDDSITLGIWVKREKEWIEALFKEKGEDTEALKKVLLDEFSEWVEEMRDWIQASTNLRQWVLWELHVGHTWEHKKGYSLLGDAAHLCTPFAGLGVNAAMKDALELSELIIDSFSVNGPTLDQAVAMYETAMFPRTEKVQRHTMKNKESMFRTDAPVSFFA